MSNDFRKQIQEDIKDYQTKYPNVKHLEKVEWAFNFWILDNFYSIDEEIIEDFIIDYNDKGIDCFVWHEDLHDLYLIQNKFYSDKTILSNEYVQNDFLTRAIGALEKGTYTRSFELQQIYNKYHNEDDFNIHFVLYITNNEIQSNIYDGIASFNKTYAEKKYDAKIYSLKDIQELYYKTPITNKKSFKYTLSTINKGTILNVDNSAYKLTLALDAKYVLTPVFTLFNMVKEAKKQGYSLFDENIREYLGSSGPINKKIAKTLKDPLDRKNFFFYNNGITIIVNDMTADNMQGTARVFDITNPQIVNGCQTVSTIYEVLNSLPPNGLEEDFQNTFVMIKILKIPSNNEQLKNLYHNIVTYNNSQNSINEKTFSAVADVFKHVQSAFDWYGFLVCIKQSDKNSFSEKYTNPTKLLDKNSKILQLFGLTELKNVKDFFIDLEKLLQVILAFKNPTNAIQHKSKILKDSSDQNNEVISFIKNTESTDKDLLYLYLLYLRAEAEKKKSEDKKIPNPFYLIYSFAQFECKGNASAISSLLNTEEDTNRIIKKYKVVTTMYYKDWIKKNPGKEYNDMIKSPIDSELLDTAKNNAEIALSV